MNRKRCICFDFDDTLVHSDDLIKEAIVRTLNYFGNNDVKKEDVVKYFGPSEPGILANILSEDDYPAAVAYFFQTYSEIQEEYLKPEPKIKELLDKVSHIDGLTVILVTGRSQETLEISLHYLGYENYFKKTYSGSVDGINKDESMKQALHDFDFNKEDMLYIGDSLADIRVMKENDYDIFSAGYFHDKDYQEKLKAENPNTFTTIEELSDAILKVI